MARKKREEESSGGGAWLNTYADLVTNLLCLFVLLFSFSSIDSNDFKILVTAFNPNVGFLEGGNSFLEGRIVGSGITQLSELDMVYIDILEVSMEEEREEAIEDYKEQEEKEKEAQAEEIANALKEGLLESNIADDVVISYNSQYIRLAMNGAVLFDSGKANLRSDAIDLVNKLGDLLKPYEKFSIAIEGHTDNVPMNSMQFPSNWHLSSGRAISVAKYFIENKGFSDENIYAVGYGEFRPAASNDTAEGRAQNRRVEIVITNTLLNKIGE